MTPPRADGALAPNETDPPRLAAEVDESRAVGPIIAAQVLLAATAALAFLASTVAAFAAPPEIRLNRANRVPACVTPERLMSFLTARNTQLESRHRDIAKWYRHHGEAMRVRWDYAFFQMLIETNYLTFRRPDGRSGDVSPRQNNFAGIGATGGGVPGDRFPDVGTGVLAQIQHLVAYSGEPVADPVAPRTALKQDDIIAASRRLARPVRFSDLARRWAADPRYGSSIEFIAEGFRREHCTGRGRGDDESAGGENLPWKRSSSHGGPNLSGSPESAWSARVEVASTEPAKARMVVPKPVAAERPRQIVRTIWQRGSGNSGPQVGAAAPAPAVAPAPHSVPATASAAADAEPLVAIAALEERDGATMSGLIGGLANMAQSIDGRSIGDRAVETEAAAMQTSDAPPVDDSRLVVPKPRLAMRAR